MARRLCMTISDKKMKVVGTRLSGSAAPKEKMEEVGVPDLVTRKTVCEATQGRAQTFGVHDSIDILWLSGKRYIAHQMYAERIEGAALEQKEKAAAEQWLRDVRNLAVRRRVRVTCSLSVHTARKFLKLKKCIVEKYIYCIEYTM